MKKYRVTIDLDAFEIVVSANNKAEEKSYRETSKKEDHFPDS